MKLVIQMPWQGDLSVNHCRMGPKGNWRYKTSVLDWMERFGWEWKIGKLEWLKGATYEFSPPLALTVDFRYPDKRRRDDHNYYKVICDAVARTLDIDDKDIRISTRSVTVDKKWAGFTITISDEEA